MPEMLKARISVKHGFSLTEMMVAIAVLLIVMAIIFGVMNMAFRLGDTTRRKVDISIEGRQVLDRIGQDVAGVVSRPDVDQYYEMPDPSGRNDQMFFYSMGAGPSSTNQQGPISLIGYRISSSANSSLTPELERVVQGVTWSAATQFPFLIFPVRTSTSVLSASTATIGTIPSVWQSVVADKDTSFSPWHTIGKQVFRFEICFQLRDGTFTLTPPTPSISPALPTAGTQPPAAVAGSVNDAVAVIVAVALLDSNSRQIVPSASWSTLIQKLRYLKPEDLSASPPALMESVWNNAINTADFASTVGIPAAAAAQIRVYQRYYPLNPPMFH